LVWEYLYLEEYEVLWYEYLDDRSTCHDHRAERSMLSLSKCLDAWFKFSNDKDLEYARSTYFFFYMIIA